MKIIGTDNMDRETVADELVASGIKNETLANIMCEALNNKLCTSDNDATFYQVVPDDHCLKRGMEELV